MTFIDVVAPEGAVFALFCATLTVFVSWSYAIYFFK